MYVGWIFAGSACAAVAVAAVGFDYSPIVLNGNAVQVPRLVQIIPMMLPSFGMLIVAALLAATENRRSPVAGELLHASGWVFVVTYLLLAAGTRDTMKVGAVLFLVAWVLMALSTIKFGRSEKH